MNFLTFRKILLLLPAAFLAGAGGVGLELPYEVDQFGPAVSMLSLHAPKSAVTAALSVDGKSFRLHREEGVFIDKSPMGFVPGGAVGRIEQVRGASGTDLVVSFNAPMVVEGREAEELVRYVFVAASESMTVPENKVPAGDDPVAERKIAELRDLVRQLTLEVVEQRKKLARCSK